ncbi:hypothetical protein VNI00_017067 [Paramarasmius palmivorus]|uniref:F-box domain-containing protein n=1 Tax=Paramarasmius palmivorus TaxID=297713 RepID=A0AAW0B926_9AGAR
MSTAPIAVPFEIWDRICILTSIPALYNTCTVSKSFNAVATPHLYRNLSFSTFPSAIKCLRTLQTNEIAAKSVVCFHPIHHTPIPPCGAAVTECLELLPKVLSRTSNLYELGIAPVVWSLDTAALCTDFGTMLRQCTIPRLANLVLNLPIDDNVVDFIARHQLGLVELGLHLLVPGTESYRLPTFDLPFLRKLDLSAEIVATFLAASAIPNVAEINVMWSPRIEATHNAARSLP